MTTPWPLHHIPGPRTHGRCSLLAEFPQRNATTYVNGTPLYFRMADTNPPRVWAARQPVPDQDVGWSYYSVEFRRVCAAGRTPRCEFVHTVRLTVPDCMARLHAMSVSSRVPDLRLFVAYKGAFQCTDSCRSASRRRAKSNETSCKALQQFAAQRSEGPAKASGQSKPLKSSPLGWAAQFDRPRIKSLASKIQQLAPSKSSSMSFCLSAES